MYTHAHIHLSTAWLVSPTHRVDLPGGGTPSGVELRRSGTPRGVGLSGGGTFKGVELPGGKTHRKVELPASINEIQVAGHLNDSKIRAQILYRCMHV